MDRSRQWTGAQLKPVVAIVFVAMVIPSEGLRMRNLMLALAAILSLGLAQAVEVGGVRVDDRTTVGSGDVVINGAGVRKKAFFKVYALALYLPEKHGDADALLAVKGAKRVAISLLRDLSAQQFVDALREGIADNHTQAEIVALNDRIKQFSEAMLSIGEAKAGTIVLIDWLPESGTRLTVNGQSKGKDIAGEDFFRALLKIWLGNKPVQDDLKQALLGGFLSDRR
jgi:hypothetical protein